jgi:hypothetical protein
VRVKFCANPTGVSLLEKEQSFEVVMCSAGGAEGAAWSQLPQLSPVIIPFEGFFSRAA